MACQLYPSRRRRGFKATSLLSEASTCPHPRHFWSRAFWASEVGKAVQSLRPISLCFCFFARHFPPIQNVGNFPLKVFQVHQHSSFTNNISSSRLKVMSCLDIKARKDCLQGCRLVKAGRLKTSLKRGQERHTQLDTASL